MAKKTHINSTHAGVTNKWTRKNHRVFDSEGKCIFEGKVSYFSLPKKSPVQPGMPSINAAKHFMRTGKSK